LFPHFPASTNMISLQILFSYRSQTSCLRKVFLPKYVFRSQRNSCRLITSSNRFPTGSRCCSVEPTIVHEHHRRRTSTLHLKMQRSEQEWSGLCQKAKSLVPKELGNEAWYLIIVSSRVSWRPTWSAITYSDTSDPPDGRLDEFSRYQPACLVLHVPHGA
jgi:hypothetical protein